MSDAAPTMANGWSDRELGQRLVELHGRIAAAQARAGREREQITLVAVTKTVPVERILAAAALGLTQLAENRVQEAREKRERLEELARSDPFTAHLLPTMRWDLIGHLQTNKAALATELFTRVQSVDSLRLAGALSARASAHGQSLPILLEVNIGGEESKSGFAPTEIEDGARAIALLPGLRIQGMMTVAPIVAQAEEARPYFREMAALRDYLRRAIPPPAATWDELSMGMSDDFEVAIEEGATLVRIGRGLFGARPAPQQAGAQPA